MRVNPNLKSKTDGKRYIARKNRSISRGYKWNRVCRIKEVLSTLEVATLDSTNEKMRQIFRMLGVGPTLTDLNVWTCCLAMKKHLDMIQEGVLISGKGWTDNKVRTWEDGEFNLQEL